MRTCPWAWSGLRRLVCRADALTGSRRWRRRQRRSLRRKQRRQRIKAALSRADGAPGGAATTLHAAKMSAARMNAARLLNGQSNVAGLRNGALHANDVALPTDDHMLGF